jgi:hypothetical protein
VITPGLGRVLKSGDKVGDGVDEGVGLGLDGLGLVGDGEEGAGLGLEGVGAGDGVVGSVFSGTGTSPRLTASDVILEVGKAGWKIFWSIIGEDMFW